MTQVVCNFCGENETTKELVLKDVRLGLPGDYHLVKCKHCGLIYLNPQPGDDELLLRYSETYHCYVATPDQEKNELQKWILRRGLQQRCHLITSYKKGGELLDIGCATGVFLEEMQRIKGWKVTGVEPVLSAAKYAQERLHLNVINKTLIETGFISGSFDVITYWDVLEHTRDPAAEIRECLRILKPGGWLIIKIPNPASKEAMWFKQSWVGYEAPQHLFGFLPTTLTAYLKKTGFLSVKQVVMGTDYRPFWDSLKIWLNARSHKNLAILVGHFYKSMTGRILSAPILNVMRKIGFQSSITYLAQKPYE